MCLPVATSSVVPVGIVVVVVVDHWDRSASRTSYFRSLALPDRSSVHLDRRPTRHFVDRNYRFDCSTTKSAVRPDID